MSNLQQQDQATSITTVNGDGNLFYPKLGSISTTTLPLPLPTTLADQT